MIAGDSIGNVDCITAAIDAHAVVPTANTARRFAHHVLREGRLAGALDQTMF
jgi:hypothetical protein